MKVRNLVVVADGSQGYLSGTLVGVKGVTITGVRGYPIKLDGTQGQMLTVTDVGQISVNPNKITVLTDGSFIRVTSPDLRPGLTAEVELSFSQGQPIKTIVPVIDNSHTTFEDIRPK